MTKKDYELLALHIRSARYATMDIKANSVLNLLTVTLSDYFTANNPRFDRAKFKQACEYGKLPRESEVA